MIQFLKTMVVKYGFSKILKFLIEVFSKSTGKILDDTYKIINKNVHLVEELSIYINNHNELEDDELIEAIEDDFQMKFNYFDLKSIQIEGGSGKFNLAYKYIINELKTLGKKYTEQAISLGIELAVNRFYGK